MEKSKNIALVFASIILMNFLFDLGINTTVIELLLAFTIFLIAFTIKFPD